MVTNKMLKPDKSIIVYFIECSLTQDSQRMTFIMIFFPTDLEKYSCFPNKVLFATSAEVQELFLFENTSSLKEVHSWSNHQA